MNKKTLVTILGCAVVIGAVLVCLFFFRFGFAEDEGDAYMKEMAALPAQKGEPDRASKELAELIGEDANDIVSVGNPLVSGNYIFTVKSWKTSKEYPGYAPPEGVDITEFPGAQADEAGNIVNDYSYITVDVSCQNRTEEEIDDLVWNELSLKFVRPIGGGSYSGELTYLGEKVPRLYGHDYCREYFEADETKDITLIYVVNDGLLDNEGMYLQINPSGAAISGEEYDVIRYIVLN